MEVIADKIVGYILLQGKISKEEYSVYKYGLQTGMEMFTCLFISAMIAILLESFVGFLIFVIVFFPLRFYVGGIHLKNFISCCVCSCSIISLILIISKVIELPLYVLTISTAVCLGGIYKLAPLTTEKVADEAETIYFSQMRRKVLLSILAITVILWRFRLANCLAVIMNTVIIVLCSMFLQIIKTKRMGFKE